MKKIIALLTLVVLVFIPSLSVLAQQSGQGLEISPPLVDQKVDPGQTVKLEIKVHNVTDSTVIAKGVVNDFIAGGEGGEPKIITDEEAEPSPYTFKPWISTVPDLKLVPQETKTAVISINVPKDASPGGHYGVVRFTAEPVDVDGTGVALSASIGTLVLLNVSGDVVQNATLEEFSVSHDNKSGSFFEKGPFTLVERVKNTGNVHFQPKGEVKVYDTFGKEIASLVINEKQGNVLPDSIRRFEQELSKTNLFGRYKAELRLVYGDGQDQTLVSTKTFWVIPYKVVLAVLVGLALLIALIRLLLKKYKKHVAEEVHEHDMEVSAENKETLNQTQTHAPGEIHQPTENSDSDVQPSDENKS